MAEKCFQLYDIIVMLFYRGTTNICRMSSRRNLIPLIEPSAPAKRGSVNNVNGDLIVYKNNKIQSQNSNSEYQFIRFLGGGAFGKVYEAIRNGEEHVSVKISSVEVSSVQQCTTERSVLKWLSNPSTDPPPYLSSLIDSFMYHDHVVIVTPLYKMSLINLLEIRNYSWFPLYYIQQFLQKLGTAIEFLHRNRVIHTDIKPENIMFTNDDDLMLIDYGACVIHPREGDVGYLQSLFYRAPEVILQLPYSYTIDIWSMGCVAAELALGLPIFCGKTAHNVLQLINIRCGGIPQTMIEDSPIADYYFDSDGEIIINPEEGIVDQCHFPLDTITNIIINFPNFNQDSPEECEKENEQRKVFVSLLEGMLKVNPEERFTIEDVLNHEFLHMKMN